MAAPNALLVMGVSGSGKSTVGALLASELGWKFYDADDYHPEENRMKMQKGIALNDKTRDENAGVPPGNSRSTWSDSGRTLSLWPPVTLYGRIPTV